MDVSYREAYSMTRVEARRRLVETYTATHSVTAAARRWHTSRSVVRKWVRRYREHGLKGLEDASRRPQHEHDSDASRRLGPSKARSVRTLGRKTRLSSGARVPGSRNTSPPPVSAVGHPPARQESLVVAPELPHRDCPGVVNSLRLELQIV